MGFSKEAVRRLTFKVQAANVIDANTNFVWYESRLENSPKITPDRILSQYAIVSSNAPSSVADLQNKIATGNLNGIVENLAGTDASPIYTELTQAINNNDTTWVAYTTAGDRSSARLLNWINPSSVPQPNGTTSSAYGVQLYKKSGTTYTEILASDQQGTGADGEVAWVFNYDQGLLLLAPDLIATLGNIDGLFIRAYRYIGTTGTGTSGALIVQDDGSEIKANTTKLNFKGNLSATLNSDVVDITDDTFIAQFISAISQWSITHNLGKFPSVTTVNNSGEIVFGAVTYTDNNNLTIDFKDNIAGKAYLN